jgi:hypothetical protein
MRWKIADQSTGKRDKPQVYSEARLSKVAHAARIAA